MRILLFGKLRNSAHLAEDVTEDFRLAGHQVLVFPYRDTKIKKMLEPWLASPRLRVPLAALLMRAVRKFRPDLILALGPFRWLPPAVFAPLFSMVGRPPLVAWIGDLFEKDMQGRAENFDAIAYTDSGMLQQHKAFNFRPPAIYLPLAATRGTNSFSATQRSTHLLFVGSATPQRHAVLSEIAEPIDVFGPDWQNLSDVHFCVARRIAATELPALYASHIGALNMRHEVNVIDGLNQRHFAPYIVGTPVIADSQKDVARCFVQDNEILIYRDVPELNEIYARLRRTPAWGKVVGEMGRKRVLAEHTYSHRLENIVKFLDLKITDE